MTEMIDPPRRPYLARGAGVKRCLDCRLPEPSCICQYRERFDTEVEFWLLTHKNETYKPTNTGRVIKACVPSTREIVWQSRTDPGEELGRLLADPGYQPILIFPIEADYEHRMITAPKRSESVGKPALILLDGTWRQARRMFRHSTYLQSLPVMSLSEARTSNYALRKALHEHQLCTAEVAISLLEQLGELEASEGLGRYFDRFNRHYIASRRRWAKRDSQTGDRVAQA